MTRDRCGVGVVDDVGQVQASLERLEKGQGELRDHILDLGRQYARLVVIIS